MKYCAALLLALVIADPLDAADLRQPVPKVIELGPHHRVIESYESKDIEDGTSEVVTNRYTELTTGMNAWSATESRWVPADPSIRIVDGRGRVDGAHHKASFSGNINDPAGAVELVTPDGERIRSKPWVFSSLTPRRMKAPYSRPLKIPRVAQTKRPQFSTRIASKIPSLMCRYVRS